MHGFCQPWQTSSEFPSTLQPPFKMASHEASIIWYLHSKVDHTRRGKTHQIAIRWWGLSWRTPVLILPAVGNIPIVTMFVAVCMVHAFKCTQWKHFQNLKGRKPRKEGYLERLHTLLAKVIKDSQQDRHLNGAWQGPQSSFYKCSDNSPEAQPLRHTWLCNCVNHHFKWHWQNYVHVPC